MHELENCLFLFHKLIKSGEVSQNKLAQIAEQLCGISHDYVPERSEDAAAELNALLNIMCKRLKRIAPASADDPLF